MTVGKHFPFLFTLYQLISRTCKLLATGKVWFLKVVVQFVETYFQNL